ncbi:MAG: ABC transporter permease [Actinomycetota bacterium]|nr:ABC transporter permease [Actinomycetota bacterium]
MAGGGLVILLTVRDLQHRAVRFVVVTLLAAVVFTLLFVMTGLVEQFNQEPYKTVDAFGATTWVIPEGITGPFTASGTLPADTAGLLDSDSAAPTVVARSSLRAGDETVEAVLIGVDVGGLGNPPIVDGRPLHGPGEVVVDTTVDASVGDVVAVAGRPFEVVGRSTDTTVLAGIPLVFATIGEVQDLVFKSREVISAVLVDGVAGTVPDGTVAVDADHIAEDVLKPLEDAVASVDLVRALLWMVAAVIVGAVVYLSALERQRDFAVLKAIGATNRSLLGGLAIQAVLVALLAVLVAAGLQALLVPVFPLQVRVPARAFAQVPLAAVAMALLAGAAGMRKVARSDPAMAFAGAGG